MFLCKQTNVKSYGSVVSLELLTSLKMGRHMPAHRHAKEVNMFSNWDGHPNVHPNIWGLVDALKYEAQAYLFR